MFPCRGFNSRVLSLDLFDSPSMIGVLGTIAAWSIHLRLCTTLNYTAGFREKTSACPYDGPIRVDYSAASTACKKSTRHGVDSLY